MSGSKNLGKLGKEEGGISENWIDAVKGLDEVIEELIHLKKTTPEQRSTLGKLLKANQVFPEPAEGVKINLKIVLETGDEDLAEMKYFFVMRNGEKLELLSGGSKSSKEEGHDSYTKFKHTYLFDDTEFSDINTVEFRNELYDLKNWLDSGAEVTISDKSA